MTVLVHKWDEDASHRVANSIRARRDVSSVVTWFHDYARAAFTNVTRVPLSSLDGWHTDEDSGNIAHSSGKFFTVEGLGVHIPGAAIPIWDQPIINQPEVGILGILVKEFDGVLHCLMQAKVEPGNANGLQLSPTVQATRSNYTGVHGGRSVPYLSFFRDFNSHRVVADVRQSEQGSWFHQKRNRNMIIEVSPTTEVELLEGFCWLTIGQVQLLLQRRDLVNMDARTVLSCLPVVGHFPASTAFQASLARSCSENSGSLHTTQDILSWITSERTRHDVYTERKPLSGLKEWERTPSRITHASGHFFDVIGVRVEAGGREVNGWTQPMIEPHGDGLIAFVVREIAGVLHVLVHARVEPGYVDVVELAPTVQCTPSNYDVLPSETQPPFLATVLSPASTVHFDTILSEEGGRFYRALNRYMIVSSDVDIDHAHPDYRWMTVHQLADLLRHSHYLNVQARSLVACLHTLLA